jgi:Flp pilus assembly protein TadD
VLAAPVCARAAQPTPTVNMIDAAVAGDAAELDRTLLQLKSQAKPPRGDRRVARDLNDQGLAFWQRQRFAEAAALFRQARAADASDAEIAENLGYALLRSGDVAGAEPVLLEALTLAPDRATAWGSLGLVYAKQGKHREGLACVLTAYRFARDKKRTLDVYSRLARSDEDPKVRAVLTEVVERVSSPAGNPS